MSERPFMQLYVSDFIGDTLQLSTEQIGAYMLLLMAMWNADGSLPDDDAKLARVVRMSVKKWRAISGDLMAYFERQDGAISHNRLTKELEKSERKSQSRASAGAKGGAAKALKNNDATLANAKQMPKHSPDTREEEKREPNGSPKKGTRLPDDWEPDLEFAQSAGLTLSQAEREADKFRDWWPAQPGQKGVKLDWNRTWKNWCRTAVERQQTRGSPPRQSASEAGYELLRDLENARNRTEDQNHLRLVGPVRQSG